MKAVRAMPTLLHGGEGGPSRPIVARLAPQPLLRNSERLALSAAVLIGADQRVAEIILLCAAGAAAGRQAARGESVVLGLARRAVLVGDMALADAVAVGGLVLL